MEKHVSLSDLLENVPVSPQFRRDLRHVRLLFVFLESFQTVTFHEESQIQRAVYRIHIVRMHFKLFL